MAGSWIKMRTNLPTDPRVVYMAAKLGKPVAHIVGACCWLWMLADEHTADGKLVGYTTAVIDRAVGVRGFCGALESLKDLPNSAGPWLEVSEGCLIIPDFTKHNGESAKARAQNNARVALSRTRSRNGDVAQNPLQVSQDARTKSVTRLDKTREDKKVKTNPPSPLTPWPDLPASVDTPEVRRALDRFLVHRQKRRKPVTPDAAVALFIKFEAGGPDATVWAINESIANDWQGCFPEKYTHGHTKQPGPTDARRAAKAQREFAEPDIRLPIAQ